MQQITSPESTPVAKQLLDCDIYNKILIFSIKYCLMFTIVNHCIFINKSYLFSVTWFDSMARRTARLPTFQNTIRINSRQLFSIRSICKNDEWTRLMLHQFVDFIYCSCSDLPHSCCGQAQKQTSWGKIYHWFSGRPTRRVYSQQTQIFVTWAYTSLCCTFTCRFGGRILYFFKS